MHICVIELGQRCLTPIHSLNQCWFINCTLGTNFNEIWIKIQKLSSNKMLFKMISAKIPFCLGENSLDYNFKKNKHWKNPMTNYKYLWWLSDIIMQVVYFNTCFLAWLANPHSVLWENKVNSLFDVVIYMESNKPSWHSVSGIILYMYPANGRWHYNVASSHIGWAHTKNNH